MYSFDFLNNRRGRGGGGGGWGRLYTSYQVYALVKRVHSRGHLWRFLSRGNSTKWPIWGGSARKGYLFLDFRYKKG